MLHHLSGATSAVWLMLALACLPSNSPAHDIDGLALELKESSQGAAGVVAGAMPGPDLQRLRWYQQTGRMEDRSDLREAEFGTPHAPGLEQLFRQAARWPDFYNLKICFFDGTPGQRERVVETFDEILSRTNLNAFFSDGSCPLPGADIQIKIESGQACWSRYGSDSREVIRSDPRAYTMALCGAPSSPSYTEDQRGLVRHEIMHAMGFVHEQQHDNAKCFDELDMEKVLKKFGLTGGPEGDLYLKTNIMPIRFQNELGNIIEAPYDKNSIMHYRFDISLLKDGIENPDCVLVRPNNRLSAGDEKMLREMYPLPSSDHRDCFDNRSCWARAPAAPPVTPGASSEGEGRVIHIGGEKELRKYLDAEARGREECLRQYEGMPDQALPEHEREQSVRQRLRCRFSEVQVEQILAYPDAAVGSNEQYAEERQGYMASERFKDCHGAFLVLRRNEGGAVRLWPEALRFAKATFKEACLDGPADVERDILNRLVFLATVIGGGIKEVYCTGFIVAPRLVLTAKHCLVSPARIQTFRSSTSSPRGDKAVDRIQLRPGTRILVLGQQRTVSDAVVFDPGGEGLGWRPGEAQSDMVLLSSPSIGADLGQFPLAVAKKGDRLSVVGALPDLVALQSAAIEQRLAGEMAKQVVMDSRVTCFAAFVGNGCIAHAYQTVSGFSGAPVFVRTEAGLSLVGVQSGFFGPEENLCGFRRSTIIPNYAVAIADSTVSRAIADLRQD